jgi:hypothetical protein
MHRQDALRHAREGTGMTDLAAAFGITPEQARAAAGVIGPEFARRLEQHTLSRGGLADLVQVLASPKPGEYVARGGAALRGAEAQSDGNAILAHLLGSKDQSRGLAARAARRAGVDPALMQEMLPALALLAMATLGTRSSDSIRELHARTPAISRLTRGSAHADLAEVLRRGLGTGRHGAGALRYLVRNLLSRAGNFRHRGALAWYTHFLLTPVRRAADRTAALVRRGSGAH